MRLERGDAPAAPDADLARLLGGQGPREQMIIHEIVYDVIELVQGR